MPTAQRKPAASLIRRLLDQPHRFELLQAIRILHAWLGNVLPNASGPSSQHLRFRNRVSFEFPPSQIEALDVEVDASSDATLPGAGVPGQLHRVSITPAWGGLLGGEGALPHHYTERITVAEERSTVTGRLDFLNLISQRAHALHYEAWKKARIYESTDAQGEDDLRRMQCALAGRVAQGRSQHEQLPGRTLHGDIPAFYTGVLRHYATSSQALGDVLTEYFDVPFEVEPFIGEWHCLDPQDAAWLGGSGSLDEGLVLGPRTYSKTERVRLRVGPLSLDEFERFLPRSEGARAIAQMVDMFRVPELTFEVQLVLRAQDVVPAALVPKGRPGLGLGYAAVSMTCTTSNRDHDGLRYELSNH